MAYMVQGPVDVAELPITLRLTTRHTLHTKQFLSQFGPRPTSTPTHAATHQELGRLGDASTYDGLRVVWRFPGEAASQPPSVMLSVYKS